MKSKQLENFRKDELGFIFQDFNLLDTLTAYENIALALTIQGVKPSEVDNKIKNVAEHLGITEVLNKYSYQMSGGQKQRIAIARILLKNAPIVILDEATAALDNNTEEYIIDKFYEALQGKTVVIISHRLSIIKNCVNINVLSQGRVVESGTHDELISLAGHYKQLYDKIA